MRDKTFGVVYKGNSTICFNCGVYGHVRDQCPYAPVDKTMPTSTTDLNRKVDTNKAEDDNVVDMIQTQDTLEKTKLGTKARNTSKSGDIGLGWL